MTHLTIQASSSCHAFDMKNLMAYQTSDQMISYPWVTLSQGALALVILIDGFHTSRGLERGLESRD